MSKDKISDYSATANSNTDIGGINIDEGCAPSGINDAIRTLMKQLKDWQSGSQDVYIHPAGSASVPSITATGDTNTGLFFPAADTVGITTGGTERARVDSSGNLGLGVTPSAWATLTGLQVKNAAMAATSNASYFGANWYYNAGDKYIASSGAAVYVQNAGGDSSHRWYNAASGTAGNAITFTQAMTLDTSGTLGIGTTSPFNPGGSGQKGIEIAGSDYGTLYVTSNSRAVTGFLGAETSASLVNVGSRTNHPFIFQTNSLERARIDSSGNFGIGTSSPSYKLHVQSANPVISQFNGNNSNNYIQISDDNGSNSVSFGAIGGGNAYMYSGTGKYTALYAGGSEAARITSGGNLLVGTTTLTSASISTTKTLQVNSEIISVGTNAGLFWENRAGGVTTSSNWYGWYTPSSTNMYLYNGSGNIASINNSSGVYTALSDRNKKKDFEDSTVGLDAVMQLKPTLFRMLDDAEDAPKQLGFIAQEVNEVIPQAYVESTMVDAGGKNSTYIGLNDRPIIAVLTKAIQEQQAIIESLTARIEALEA